mmetsp:Transcript_12926/g.39134  ORF Transcript_12926/g.39134 Transcript_12926/m.39134 type:complete len:964 (+) Transcript_12926:179-3070(+)
MADGGAAGMGQQQAQAQLELPAPTAESPYTGQMETSVWHGSSAPSTSGMFPQGLPTAPIGPGQRAGQLTPQNLSSGGSRSGRDPAIDALVYSMPLDSAYQFADSAPFGGSSGSRALGSGGGSDGSGGAFVPTTNDMLTAFIPGCDNSVGRSCSRSGGNASDGSTGVNGGGLFRPAPLRVNVSQRPRALQGGPPHLQQPQQLLQQHQLQRQTRQTDGSDGQRQDAGSGQWSAPLSAPALSNVGSLGHLMNADSLSFLGSYVPSPARPSSGSLGGTGLPTLAALQAGMNAGTPSQDEQSDGRNSQQSQQPQSSQQQYMKEQPHLIQQQQVQSQQRVVDQRASLSPPQADLQPGSAQRVQVQQGATASAFTVPVQLSPAQYQQRQQQAPQQLSQPQHQPQQQLSYQQQQPQPQPQAPQQQQQQQQQEAAAESQEDAERKGSGTAATKPPRSPLPHVASAPQLSKAQGAAAAQSTANGAAAAAPAGSQAFLSQSHQQMLLARHLGQPVGLPNLNRLTPLQSQQVLGQWQAQQPEQPQTTLIQHARTEGGQVLQGAPSSNAAGAGGGSNSPRPHSAGNFPAFAARDRASPSPTAASPGMARAGSGSVRGVTVQSGAPGLAGRPVKGGTQDGTAFDGDALEMSRQMSASRTFSDTLEMARTHSGPLPIVTSGGRGSGRSVSGELAMGLGMRPSISTGGGGLPPPRPPHRIAGSPPATSRPVLHAHASPRREGAQVRLSGSPPDPVDVLAGRVRGIAPAGIAGSPGRQSPVTVAPAAAAAPAPAADVAVSDAAVTTALPAVAVTSAPAVASATELEMQPSAFASAAAQVAPVSPGTPASPPTAASPMSNPATPAAVAATAAAPATEAAADDALAAVLAEPLPEVPAASAAAAAAPANAAAQPGASAAAPLSAEQPPVVAPGAFGRSPARREGSLKHWINDQAPQTAQQTNPAADAQAAVAAGPPVTQAPQ